MGRFGLIERSRAKNTFLGVATMQFSQEDMTNQKENAVAKLMSEINKGWDSVHFELDWVSEEEAHQLIRRGL